MPKKPFNKSAKKISPELKALRNELRGKRAQEEAEHSLSLALSRLLRGDGEMAISYIVEGIAITGLYKMTENHKRKWANSAGQKVEAKAFVKRCLKDLEEQIYYDLLRQNRATDLEEKKRLRTSIASNLEKYKPLIDQVKIVKPVTDDKNEPYFFKFRYSKNKNNIEVIAFTGKPFEQALTYQEKLKKDPKKGFGL
jgi:hypothetical protein